MVSHDILIIQKGSIDLKKPACAALCLQPLTETLGLSFMLKLMLYWAFHI